MCFLRSRNLFSHLNQYSKSNANDTAYSTANYAANSIPNPRKATNERLSISRVDII